MPPELKLAVETLSLKHLMLADVPAATLAKAAAAPKGAAAPRRAEGPLASIAQIDVADVLLDWRTRAVTGPGRAAGRIRPSISRTGVTPPKVPVTNASSAPRRSSIEKSPCRSGTPFASHKAMTFARVTPLKQYSPDDVRTSPSLTQNRLVALQLETKPWGSSITASSAPLSMTSSRARIRFSRL